jgi:hypothetical protein
MILPCEDQNEGTTAGHQDTRQPVESSDTPQEGTD